MSGETSLTAVGVFAFFVAVVLGISFYLVAMLFIVFDIEVAFLYPLAVVLKSVGVAAVVELVVFVAVLGAGLAYVWRKRALEWR